MTKEEYNNLNNTLQVFDGRGKGVDIYVCEKCKSEIHTRYRDLGVTPPLITCRKQGCNGDMLHISTRSEEENRKVSPFPDLVCEWYRPSYRYYRNAEPYIKDHLENGGLILDETPLRNAGVECTITSV